MSIAKWPHPFPSRTRQLSTSAAMVLCKRAWESSSMPEDFFVYTVIDNVVSYSELKMEIDINESI